MTERDFDKCPECGAFPVFGLRCHPKYSLRVGMRVADDWDMVALYAHDEETIRSLATKFASQDILSMDRWDGQQWVEFF